MKPFHDAEASYVAAALLAGEFEPQAMLARVRPLITGSKKWLAPLVDHVLTRFGRTRPRKRQLVRFIVEDQAFNDPLEGRDFTVKPYLKTSRFVPANERFSSLAIPRWNTVGELSEWLGMKPGTLDWFADRKCLERVVPNGPLRHYRYHWVRKRGGQSRLIEAPKRRLKIIQRRLLRELLEAIPVHDAAHGFRSGRSVRSFVEPHVGQPLLLKMDLQDFFPSLQPSRLIGLLMTIGYSEEVARTITALCTNHAPADVWRMHPRHDEANDDNALMRSVRRPHFPQGAPTSPAIANLIVYRLDCRLTGLARWGGATYTRYADDLLFSGGDEFRRKLERFKVYVAAIALEEGFRVHHHKTRARTSSQSQRAAGLTLNVKPNLARRDFDRLKAVLHRAITRGRIPRQYDGHDDFRAHLLGCIQYVREWNPPRADKLMRMFELIEWE